MTLEWVPYVATAVVGLGGLGATIFVARRNEILQKLLSREKSTQERTAFLHQERRLAYSSVLGEATTVLRALREAEATNERGEASTAVEDLERRLQQFAGISADAGLLGLGEVQLRLLELEDSLSTCVARRKQGANITLDFHEASKVFSRTRRAMVREMRGEVS